jgi:hypothetical protein
MPIIFSPENFGQVTFAENFSIGNTVENIDLNQRFSVIYPDKAIHFSPMSQRASRITALKIYSTILITFGLAFLYNSFRDCYRLYSQNLFIVLTPKFQVTPSLTASIIPHLPIRIDNPEQKDNSLDVLNLGFLEFPRSHNGTPSATSAVGSTPLASSETFENFDGSDSEIERAFSLNFRELPRIQIPPTPASLLDSIEALTPINGGYHEEDEPVHFSSVGSTPIPFQPRILLGSGFPQTASPDGIPDLSAAFPPAFAVVADGRPVFVPRAVNSRAELMEALASNPK